MSQLLGVSSKTSALILVVLSGITLAGVGDEVAVITPQPPSVQSYCAIGVAFDGTSLYVTMCGDYNIYRIDPNTGNLQAPPFDMTSTIPERPAGMVYDGSRHGLWIGTQKPTGINAWEGCCDEAETREECDGRRNERSMPVYFWDFSTGTVELKFPISLSFTNENGRVFFPGPSCVMSGIAYVANNMNSDGDALWITDDASKEIGVFRPDGRFIKGHIASTVSPSFFRCNGLGMGKDTVYMSNQVLGDVFRANRLSNPLAAVGSNPFVETTDRWQVDMECDPVTFAPKSVMWVRTSPQGNAANDFLTAYEIEPGGCETGISIGACCDSAASTCRDVPQTACQGTWAQGVSCADLEPACFPVHRIILLDRTGSMQVITSDGRTRCVRALETAKSEVMSFFTTKPIGSSLAVWTFAGTEPSQLTSGFVDEATALSALATLEGEDCLNTTPLAEAMCEATDFFVGEFPSAPTATLEISISSDGIENMSDGECFGPQSTAGSACSEFDAGSWQQKVCSKVQDNAVVLVKYWGPPEKLAATGETDAETGELRGATVSDLTFFEAIAQATGGGLVVIRDDEPVPSGPSIFGVSGACCLPTGQCQDAVTQAECASLSGTHQGANSTCNNLPQPCAATIPAVSEWGVAILSLTVLVGGTIVLRRGSMSAA